MAATGTLPNCMKAKHLLRYGEIGRLLVAHRAVALGTGDLPDGEAAANPEDAQSLATEFEAMGPTFVKLGQLLSTRADVLPPDYLEALSRLQDHVEPMPFDDVER